MIPENQREGSQSSQIQSAQIAEGTSPGREKEWRRHPWKVKEEKKKKSGKIVKVHAPQDRFEVDTGGRRSRGEALGKSRVQRMGKKTKTLEEVNRSNGVVSSPRKKKNNESPKKDQRKRITRVKMRETGTETKP